MTVGRKQYNEGDLMQMQRDAETRVREMQNRARQTVEETNDVGFQPHNRNWSQNPGMRRQRPGFRPMGQQRLGNGQNAPPTNQARPELRQRLPEPPPEQPPRGQETPHSPDRPEPPQKKDGTIVGDIMDALGLDEDYLLIIGLMLILLNQRADTTLILALAYLLI